MGPLVCPGVSMNPEKLHKLLSIAIFMYSFGMAFALLFFGKFSLEVSIIGLGYFILITAWLWVMIGDFEKHN